MGSALVKHLTPREIECGMCGEIDNHDHPDDRKAVPILNGEPTTSEGECDGYHAVCAKCYLRWSAWDDRMLAAKPADIAAAVTEINPQCLRDDRYDQNAQGPCSAGQCQWPACKPTE